MHDLTGYVWKDMPLRALASMYESTESTESTDLSGLVVMFKVPTLHRDAAGVRVRTVSGYVTDLVRLRSGESECVGFAVEGELFRARPDFTVSVWCQVI